MLSLPEFSPGPSSDYWTPTCPFDPPPVFQDPSLFSQAVQSISSDPGFLAAAFLPQRRTPLLICSTASLSLQPHPASQFAF